MPQSLRSILGKSNRVRKPVRPSTPSRQSTPSSSPRKTSKEKPNKKGKQSSDDAAIFEEKLDDRGVARLVAEELTLRDVVQAMRYIRAHMFTAVPERGFTSTRTAELLGYRASMPAVITTGHVHAVLGAPSRVEREVAELLGNGIVRKVRVERRGGAGEALIEAADLERMVGAAALLSEEARSGFIAFLRANPTAQTMPLGEGGGGGGGDGHTLTAAQMDELVRHGFLTSSSLHGGRAGNTLHVRPEDRTTLMSLQRVSRYASGSVSAVGGPNAVHLAGGGGGAPSLTHASSATSSLSSSSPSSPLGLRLAVPGHGRYLKLAEAAVDWLREALGRTQWGECPEVWLRERFEGGGLYGTRWKEFWGLEWEWLVGEAVGLGVVELFETGSVGRGIRALGG
jgi:hypothetical protein